MIINDKLEAEANHLWESYFFPGTTTLKNKLNIIDSDELKEKEAEISFERLVELYENPIQGDFDAEHLKQIHKYLFDDLYEWAGEYRYVDMQKETGFTSYEMIPFYLKSELDLMNEEIKYVKEARSLASFLATYYAQLMAIHPFREGNGRSCREFLREFVAAKTIDLQCGPYEIDWSKFDNQAMLNNVQFSLVFRGATEVAFFKALVPASRKDSKKNNK